MMTLVTELRISGSFSFILISFIFNECHSFRIQKFPERVLVSNELSVKDSLKVDIMSSDKILQLHVTPLCNDIWSTDAEILTISTNEDGVNYIGKTNVTKKMKLYHNLNEGTILGIRGNTVHGILNPDLSIRYINEDHYISENSQVFSSENDYLEIPISSNSQEAYENLNAKESFRHSNRYTAEISVLVDSVWANAIGSDDDIYEYLTIFWNAVNKRFETIDNPKISLKLVGAVIVRNTHDEIFMGNKTVAENIVVRTAIYDLRKWVFENEKVLPMNDIFFLQTGRDMVKEDGSHSISGVGFRGSACAENKVAIGEDIGGFFGGVYNAAHEIAHSLGAYHDEDTKHGSGDCPWSDGYIMSYISGKITSLFFSKCSKDAMRNYTSSSQASCLSHDVGVQNIPCEIDVGDTLPGDVISMDEQCKHLTGKYNAYVDTSVTPEDSLCFKLICKYKTADGQTWWLQSGTVAEGSICPSGGKCLNGKCIKY